MINMNYDYFLNAGNDGNLSLNTSESRIQDAARLLNNGECIQFEDGVRCNNLDELRQAINKKINHSKEEVPSTCPNCGANVELNTDMAAFVCPYCKSIVAYTPRAIDGTDNTPVLRKVEPEIEFTANQVLENGNTQGGHLWITEYEVVFKPHKLNFGPLGKRYIKIQDVIGYQKGMMTYMSIFTNDGYEMVLAVWSKDEIINEIEKRRDNYFKKRGLPTPQLAAGSARPTISSVSYDSNEATPASSTDTSGCLGSLLLLLTPTILGIGYAIYNIFA